MPRNFLYTRDEIIQAALSLTREQGIGALTARALGHRLGTTAKPIFSQFASMEEVQCAVRQEARRTYETYLRTDMQAGHYPPYKASGMAYIQFAKDERNIFNLLFMRDRTNEKEDVQNASFEEIVSILMANYGLPHEEAQLFHLEMWSVVHGIAAMQATSFLNLDADMASTCLTNVFEGLKLRLELRKKEQEKGELRGCRT